MDKFLICGLGNPGDEYAGTRHNTGFMVLDAFAKASNIHFEDKRYGFVAETSIKGRKVFLLKPTTFMNLSGNAVRYWLQQEKIDQKRLLVISDELALPLGAFRLKAGGTADTTDWDTSSNSSDKTMPVCVWASETIIPVEDRWTGYWDTTPRRTCANCSLHSTWAWKSSRVSCCKASTPL